MNIRVVKSSEGGFYLVENAVALTDTFPDRESAEDWKRTLESLSRSAPGCKSGADE